MCNIQKNIYKALRDDIGNTHRITNIYHTNSIQKAKLFSSIINLEVEVAHSAEFSDPRNFKTYIGFYITDDSQYNGNSNFQVKKEKGWNCHKFELSRVKLYRK